jgi:hypothetical protein
VFELIGSLTSGSPEQCYKMESESDWVLKVALVVVEKEGDETCLE